VVHQNEIGNFESNNRESFFPNGLLTSYCVPEGKGKEAIWSSISSSIINKKTTPMVPMWKRTIRVAAILLPFAIVSFFTLMYLTGKRSYVVEPGAQLVMFLPDSSRVILNADTKISFNSATWGLSRRVEMEGEALFHVKKGKQFRVVTSTSTTQVLGTIFNVYSRQNEVRVLCIEGSVQVTHRRTKQTQVLTPGLKTTSNAKAILHSTPERKEAMASWINGEFFFENEPLQNVLEEISRQFKVTVKYNNAIKRNYTGYFNNKNLNEALDLVCLPMNLSWIEANGEYRVTEK
jgi:ferric-dicitrate binding protein FerR (iron transport regulator)